VIPRARLILLVAAAAVPFLLSAFVPGAAAIGILVDLVLLAFAAADLLVTPSPRRIAVEREASEVLSVGAENPVRIRAQNRSRVTVTVEIRDEPPEPSETDGLPVRLVLSPWKVTEAVYRLRPRQRGRRRFSAVHLRYPSRFRLWTLMERRPLVEEVKIYPDIRAVHRFDLLAMRNRLQEVGLKLWRLRGRGGEFERLREYRRDDEMRHIDWKATAKHERLISREYTVERNQNIVFLLDTGRSMGNESDGISHLDLGLNAVIILSYIALAQGDNVSLMAFSNRMVRVVGPLRGRTAIQQVIRATYDLAPSDDASDYELAYEELLRRQRKRALVVLVTHTLDEQHLRTMGTYLKTLTTPHLLLCAFLRDVGLTTLANRVPANPIEAFQSAAAAEVLTVQTRRVAELRDAGVFVLELLPHELSSALINQYLDLKARHLL